jgi:catechol 2,3-dioxygenase-like lactoylglutathione lyase family enzyme
MALERRDKPSAAIKKAMKVQRICFLSTRTANFDATAIFFRDVLGLDNAHTELGWSIFRLPTGKGEYAKVYGPEKQNADLFPAEIQDGLLVAFAVDDLVGAREELESADVELIGDIVWAADLFDDPEMAGYGWFFFRGPDGNIYAMQQDTRSAAS